MDRSSFIGFLITLIIALFLASGYIIYKATQNPTPPRKMAQPPRATTTQPSATPTKPQPPKSPPLQVEPVQFQEPVSDPELKLTMSRQLKDGGSVQPGGKLDITLVIEQSGTKPVRALGIQELLPKGWSFDGVVEGTKPDLTPPTGRTPLLEFAWFNIPTFPVSFTYRVNVPKEFNEASEIQGQTLYRADGGELRTEVVKSPVVPASVPVSGSEERKNTEQSVEDKSDEMQPDAVPEAKVETSARVNQEQKPSEPKKELADGTMKLTRELSSGNVYTPGEKIQVTANLQYTGSKKVTALALVESLPSQFQFERLVEGPTPPIVPKQGEVGTLQFVWVSIPDFPIKLTYEVSVSSDANGEKFISGQVVYHTDGPQLQSERVLTKLTPAKQ